MSEELAKTYEGLLRIGVANLWLQARRVIEQKWANIAAGPLKMRPPSEEKRDEEADQLCGEWLRKIDHLKSKGLWYSSLNGHDPGTTAG